MRPFALALIALLLLARPPRWCCGLAGLATAGVVMTRKETPK